MFNHGSASYGAHHNMSYCARKLLLVATIVWLLHVVHTLVDQLLFVGLLVLVLLALGLIVAWLFARHLLQQFNV